MTFSPRFSIKYLDYFILILITIGIYFSELLSSYFTSFEQSRTAFFFLVILATLGKSIVLKKMFIHEHFLYYGALGLLFGILSLPFWTSYSSLYAYVGFWTALIVLNADYNNFKKILIGLVVLQFLLVFYEYYTKEFLFVHTRIINGKEIRMDEIFIGGHAGIFRAKGLFSGPLSLGQFAIGSSLLLNRKYLLVSLNLITCFLASSRLGILCTSLILCYSLYVYYIKPVLLVKYPRLSLKVVVLIIISIISIPAMIQRLEIQSLNRILSAFDFNDSANNARINFWVTALEQYKDYSFYHMFFGNAGYFRTVSLNSAENSYLNLLLENGLLGLAFYMVPVLILFLFDLIYLRKEIFLILVLIIALFIQTYYLGASANLLYWLFILISMKDLFKYRYEKTAHSYSLHPLPQ